MSEPATPTPQQRLTEHFKEGAGKAPKAKEASKIHTEPGAPRTRLAETFSVKE